MMPPERQRQESTESNRSSPGMSSPKSVRLSSKIELEDPEEHEEDADMVHRASTLSSSVSDWKARMSSTSGARTGGVTSNFIMTRGNTVAVSQSRHIQLVTTFLKHPITGNCLGLLTLFDAYLSCADIDRRAAGIPEPLWLSLSMDICLLACTVEA
ncbi:hypothetical protein AK812_SmicGene37037 [Symbiodinium microadriaticum]|uniref:Uncharacterized protein n=1 Tax=Symbiodinium microadriaticum TaxID=2951 RepID=A0A1Q9CHA3_SYMMI|nr:hypothetical protein AK812_SmicGene37037 [Symbiodinium microadriaticum]